MWKLGAIAAFSCIAGCSTSGPINSLSKDTRETVGSLNAAYSSFSKTSAEVSAARIDLDARYRQSLAELQRFENNESLVEKLAEHPTLRLENDLKVVQDNLVSDFLAPPASAEFKAQSEKALVAVAGPSEQLGAVGAALKQLEKPRSSFDALIAFGRFAAETVELVERGLEEGKKYREELLKATEKSPQTENK